MQDRSRKYLASLLLICGLVATIVYFNRDSYGTVGSRGYEFATALFSACNRRDAATIEKLESMVDSAASRRELTEQEIEWLRGILADANAGDWQAAAKDSRSLLQAQVTEP